MAGSRFQYTGQIAIPEAGLYYYKARIYSPSIGRFLQTDPLGYVDGPNLYAYVGGDPVNNVDPSGLKAQTVCTSGPFPFCVTIDVGGDGTGGGCNDAGCITIGHSGGGSNASSGSGFGDNYLGIDNMTGIGDTLPPFDYVQGGDIGGNSNEQQQMCEALRPNGCGSAETQFVPERPLYCDFTEACRVHDLCYGTSGSTQEQCDSQFLDDMLFEAARRSSPYRDGQLGARCISVAFIYYGAVNFFGDEAFERAQSLASQCNN